MVTELEDNSQSQYVESLVVMVDDPGVEHKRSDDYLSGVRNS